MLEMRRHFMKKTGFSYPQVALVAMIMELNLLSIQFLYLVLSKGYATAEAGFILGYMRSTGCCIFQIIGFLLYALMAYVIGRKNDDTLLLSLTVLIVAGGIAAFMFYRAVGIRYALTILYSIPGKVIGAALGWTLLNYVTDRKKKPQSRLL
jgi:hypothetical protein